MCVCGDHNEAVAKDRKVKKTPAAVRHLHITPQQPPHSCSRDNAKEQSREGWMESQCPRE